MVALVGIGDVDSGIRTGGLVGGTAVVEHELGGTGQEDDGEDGDDRVSAIPRVIISRATWRSVQQCAPQGYDNSPGCAFANNVSLEEVS